MVAPLSPSASCMAEMISSSSSTIRMVFPSRFLGMGWFLGVGVCGTSDKYRRGGWAATRRIWPEERYRRISSRMMRTRKLLDVLRMSGAGLCLLACGCPVTAPLPTAAEIKEKSLGGEPGGKYYLYVPS